MILANFSIHCVPPTTTSQQKGVMVIAGKPRFFKKAKVRHAEEDLLSLLMPHAPKAPFQGPLKLTVTLVFPWRKTEKKSELLRGVAPHFARPDFDNLSKMICDSMSRLGFWNDDGQVSDGRIAKRRGFDTGIAVTIETDDCYIIGDNP